MGVQRFQIIREIHIDPHIGNNGIRGQTLNGIFEINGMVGCGKFFR